MPERGPRLRRLLGPDRYLRLRHWLERALGVAVFLGFIIVAALFGAVYWLSRPPPNNHDGYVTARVLTTQTVPSADAPPSYTFTVTLPGGRMTTVSTNTLAQASAVIDLACLERRIDTAGAVQYRLSWPTYCE